MAHTWDPERYLTYADERGRPFVDLLARIGAGAPRTVIDLGCGPGNLTRLLIDRWPDADVLGLDSSPEMIAKARELAGLRFQVADLRDWTPAEPVDVLVSNATLQWVPGHLDLLPRLAGAVAPGGWLAFQVPGNFDEPSHTLRDELAAQPPYAEHTAGVAVPSSHDPAVYLDALAGLGCAVDAWETTYFHLLTGPDPVFAWVSGTARGPLCRRCPTTCDRASRPSSSGASRPPTRSTSTAWCCPSGGSSWWRGCHEASGPPGEALGVGDRCWRSPPRRGGPAGRDPRGRLKPTPVRTPAFKYVPGAASPECPTTSRLRPCRFPTAL